MVRNRSQKGGATFGWSAIALLCSDDLERARNKLNVRVPGMKLSYVVRDAWTRLNVRVKPSKIMQQRACITAIKLKAEAENDASLMETAYYLSACNKLFENRFLLPHFS